MHPIMCLFHVVIRCKYSRNTPVLLRKYSLNTLVLWRKYVRNTRVLHHKCIRFTFSKRPVMCLFRAVLRRKNVTNESLMRLSSTRPVIYRFRTISRREYSLNTLVLWCYTPEICAFCSANAFPFYVYNRPCNVPLSCRLTSKILPKHTRFIVKIRPKIVRFRAANASQTHRKLPVFCPHLAHFLPGIHLLSARISPAICPQSARKHAYLMPQTRPLCAAKAPQTRLTPQTCPRDVAKRRFCAAKAPTNTPV